MPGRRAVGRAYGTVPDNAVAVQGFAQVVSRIGADLCSRSRMSLYINDKLVDHCPATPGDLRKRFETFLNDRCKGKDASKLRFVVE